MWQLGLGKVCQTGVILTNVSCAALTHSNPKSIKFQSKCQYLFALVGSAPVKTSHNMLMELTPVGHF